MLCNFPVRLLEPTYEANEIFPIQQLLPRSPDRSYGLRSFNPRARAKNMAPTRVSHHESRRATWKFRPQASQPLMASFRRSPHFTAPQNPPTAIVTFHFPYAESPSDLFSVTTYSQLENASAICPGCGDIIDGDQATARIILPLSTSLKLTLQCNQDHANECPTPPFQLAPPWTTKLFQALELLNDRQSTKTARSTVTPII